jgi:hypothetical protein
MIPTQIKRPVIRGPISKRLEDEMEALWSDIKIETDNDEVIKKTKKYNELTGYYMSFRRYSLECNPHNYS